MQQLYDGKIKGNPVIMIKAPFIGSIFLTPEEYARKDIQEICFPPTCQDNIITSIDLCQIMCILLFGHRLDESKKPNITTLLCFGKKVMNPYARPIIDEKDIYLSKKPPIGSNKLIEDRRYFESHYDGRRPYDNESLCDDRSYGGQSNRLRDDRSYGGQRNHLRDDRSCDDRSCDDRSCDDRSCDDRSYGDRSCDDRSYGDRSYDIPHNGDLQYEQNYLEKQRIKHRLKMIEKEKDDAITSINSLFGKTVVEDRPSSSSSYYSAD